MPLLIAIAAAAAAGAVRAQDAPLRCTIFVRSGFVPAGGPAAADGGTPASALASIADAARRVANPGDVVCVGPGEYREGNITPQRSGVEGFPIEFRGDPSGAATGDAPGAVRIVPPPPGPDGFVPTAGFRLLGARHMIIDGFVIEGFFDAAVQVRSAVVGAQHSGDVTVRNLVVRQTAKTGIDISGEGRMVVEGNEVLGNGGSGISVQGCGDAVGVAPRCRAGSSGPVEPLVSANRIGINLAHGLYIENAEHGVIQHNVVFSNQATGITLRAAADSVVLNNLVYANREQGVAVGSATLAAPRAVLASNTLYGNGDWGISIGSAGAASPGAMVLYNVLEHNGEGRRGIGVLNESDVNERSTCDYVAGFNVTADDYGPATPWNVYDVRASPRFVEPVAGADGVLGGWLEDGRIVDASVDDRFVLTQGPGDVSPAVNVAPVLAASVGLGGTTAADGRPDSGRLDAGYHAGVGTAQMVQIAAPYMPLYVRQGGDDDNRGKQPADAFATIRAAARRARAGVTIVVGPGRYRECDIGPPPNMGRAAFVADDTGRETGDRPGAVLVDAGCCRGGRTCEAGQTGFNVGSTCGVAIEGFHVRGARDDGLQIHSDSHRGAVRNTITFSNDKRGIQVVNSHDVQLVNNLAYANGGGGIQVGGACRGSNCASAGSLRAVVEHNTCYGNGVNGILVGAGAGVSSHARLRYNIAHVGAGEVHPPGENGIQLGSNASRGLHLEGYTPAFNLVFAGRYGAGTPRGPSDRLDDPLFVDPAGFDGELGGDGFADDNFRLAQHSAGQAVQSPAVDFSDVSAEDAGFATRTTRLDGLPDTGWLDLGFHYPTTVPPPLRAGDCNDDGRVSIDELVRAVRIGLGELPVSSCPTADGDGDGDLSIDELTRAVRVALAQGD